KISMPSEAIFSPMTHKGKVEFGGANVPTMSYTYPTLEKAFRAWVTLESVKQATHTKEKLMNRMLLLDS
ncbi:hypothetical protein, partial [Bacillus cereus]